jgi:hypothetical protein
MAEDIERILYHAEDFLRRNVLRPASAREAKKRRARRRMEEMLRRMRRAGAILAGLLVALIVASIFVGVGFFTWLIALPTLVLVSLLSLSWPTRRQREQAAPVQRGQTRSLAEMAVRVEEGLMDRSAELPARALPFVDSIVARLGELQPHLGALAPGSVEEGEARRLICEHLPRLVDTYMALPPSERAPYSENSTRFSEGLGLVAGELDELLETCCRDKQLRFDTQHRFLETRYRQDPKLSGQ